MRIVYFLPDVDAGVSRIVKTLLKYRPPDKEIKYAVVLFRGVGERLNAIDSDFNADEIIRFSYNGNENAWDIFRRFSAALLSDQDIIIGNDGLEVKMVAALKLKNPVIYIMHGDFPYYYSIAKQYQAVIDCFITYSNKIERELKNILPSTAANKVYKAYYPSAPVENKINVVTRTKNGIFTILFAGLLVERKGADILFAIYNSLLAQGMSDFDFEIIGAGDLSETIHAQFKNCTNVTVAGWQPNEYVLEKMASADILLFPSTLEGLPNVLVEALSMRAVPVASNLESGISDIIENGVNGILAEPGSVKGFSDAILSLYHNPEQLSLMKSNAAQCLSKFEPYKQAAMYQQLILTTARDYYGTRRSFPPYKRGRALDRSWLPGALVVFLRKLIKNPKL